MAMNPWLRRSSLLLLVALPWSPIGCVSGETPADGSSGTSSGSAGGTSGSAGQAHGGNSGGAGKATTAGSSGVGGAVMGVGGAVGTGGAVGAGGATMLQGGTSGAAGSAVAMGGSSVLEGGAAGTTGGAPFVGGASGVGGIEGSMGGLGTGGGVVDPCASVTCGADQVCMNGTCMCNSGKLCGAACVDTTSDAKNCGDCGKACAADGSCVDGTCVNPMCNVDKTTYSGHVTHYTLATSMVACHYPTSSLPQLYGAMNEYDWNTAGVCGACVKINNGGSSVTVQIVDECPEKGNEQWCFKGSHHIDLNPNASNQLNAGSNPAVTWNYVPCPTVGFVTGNLKYYFDSASQQYYLAVTPMNHANLVAKMEVKKGGAWTALTRTNYNTYELKDGAGTGMLSFRLTDIYNHVLTDTVTMTPGQIVNGGVQFPACP